MNEIENSQRVLSSRDKGMLKLGSFVLATPIIAAFCWLREIAVPSTLFFVLLIIGQHLVYKSAVKRQLQS